MSRTIEHVEDVVARDLSAYLADGSDDAMVRLGDSLAAAIDILLRNEDGWSRWRTVDGLSIDAVDNISPLGVGLRGVVIWYDGPKWWIDPFQAVLELQAAGGSLTRLAATVGDASTGVGTVPYESKRPRAWEDISEWAFSVTRGTRAR